LDGQIQMGIESSDEMAGFLGAQYLNYGTIETLEEILEKYHTVSLQDVKEVASLLKREHLYLYYVQ
jgi:predicted Zn-dependent peptidase